MDFNGIQVHITICYIELVAGFYTPVTGMCITKRQNPTHMCGTEVHIGCVLLTVYITEPVNTLPKYCIDLD